MLGQAIDLVPLWWSFYRHELEEKSTKSRAWEYSNFREVPQLTDLLLKFKRSSRQMGDFDNDDENRDICFPGSTRKEWGLAFSDKMSHRFISLIKKELISNQGGRAKKETAAFQDVLEEEGVSDELRDFLKNLSY